LHTPIVGSVGCDGNGQCRHTANLGCSQNWHMHGVWWQPRRHEGHATVLAARQKTYLES
jgi:hypothetical protein